MNEFESFLSLIDGDSSINSEMKKNSRNIKNCLLPAMRKVMEIIVVSSKHVAPITGMKVACAKKERHASREVVDTANKRKSPDLQVLESYVKTSSTAITPSPKSKKKPRLSRASKSKAAGTGTDELTITLPVPVNGIEYSKFEMLDLIESYPEKSAERCLIVKEMMWLKYVPCGQTVIYRLIKKRKAKELAVNSAWATSGRPPILDENAMKEVALRVENECGRSFQKKNLNRIIVEHQKKMITEAGHVPFHVPDKLKDSTLRNDATQVAIYHNVSLVTKTVSKTNWKICCRAFLACINSSSHTNCTYALRRGPQRKRRHEERHADSTKKHEFTL
jgi:hypothetical protein